MTCARCPHMARIKAALAPCQKCEAGKLHGEVSRDAWRADNVTAADMSGHGATGDGNNGDAAQSRNPITKGATGATDANADADRREPWRPTTLPPETENAMRVALASLFALEPLDLLLLRHVMAGGTYADFRPPLAALRDKLNSINLDDGATSFRATAKQWADRFLALHPTYAPIFAATVDANKGLAQRRIY